MKKYTLDSTIAEMIDSPLGADLFDKLMSLVGKEASDIKDRKLAKLKIKSFHRVSMGKIGKSTLEKVCDILNSEEEFNVFDDCEIQHKWWKEAVFYQIYPRSFNDSNGDGIGDINGIIEKLDYLKELGIDCIWCSPMYDSPNDDNGYDIRDYYKIMAEFGTMKDFDKLLDEVHKRDMKIIMDLVVNHTSDEHEWFVKAKESKDNPYHDYYIWKEGKDKETPPNNWLSLFSGPAWNYYDNLNEWALHIFSKKQMDLNWDNENVRKDVYKMMNWWLDKGIDGFRMDVITFISKWPNYPEGDGFLGMATGFLGAENYFYGPNLHKYYREMRENTFGNRDCVTVGEAGGLGINTSKMITADNRKELDLVFNFDALDNNGHTRFDKYNYDLREAVGEMVKWQTEYTNHCWPTVFFENHDNPRVTSKVDHSNIFRAEISKLCATVQMTFKGTPFIYQGQELSMCNCNFESIEELQDVESINRYKELIASGKTESEAFEKVRYGTRDNARTPVQWADSENAGFTTGTPWLKINKDYRRFNAKNQMEVEDSVFNYYKKLIKLRKDNPALIYGSFEKVRSERLRPELQDNDVLCYFRELNGQKFFIEINLVKRTRRRFHSVADYELVASSYGYTKQTLMPFEANIYKVIF